MDLSPYQNIREEDLSAPDEEEQVKLLDGYGGVYDNDAATDVHDEDVGLFRKEDAEVKRMAYKRWAMIGVATLMFVAATAGFAMNHMPSIMSSSSSDLSNVEMLGKSKPEKLAAKKKKEEEKEKKAAAKAAEKKKKEEAKAAEKKKKEDAKAAAKAEKEKKKEAAAAKKAAEKKAKEPFAANASGCHLASVHNMIENSKMHKDGLFKMSFGPEIGMSFASGKPISKTFWFGGYHLESEIDESEWTDDSPWDFGPTFINATEGCLSSKVNFTELAFLTIPIEDHWDIMDCETPLPAVYKCCTKFEPVNATIAPEPAAPAI
ncbi:MAG: hypothetical protein SGARI_000362 [Bacillariaceae sp.]